MAATCARHPEREASGTCTRCGVFVCALCTEVVDAKPYCKTCAARPDVDWLEGYRQRLLGRRDGWAWLFLIAAPAQAFLGLFALYSAVASGRPVEAKVVVFCALDLLAAIAGALWFARVRAARWGYLGVGVAFSAMFAVSSGLQAENLGPLVLVLLLQWIVLVVPLLSVRSRLFFRLPVTRAALLRDYRRMEDNRIARWGTLAGVLGLALPFFPLLALALGGIGLRRVNPNALPPVGNKGYAVAALALGVLGLATTGLWLWLTRLFGLLG